MHHIAYKLMRKPSNASRRKAQRSNEQVSRSSSPVTPEQVLQDREEITRLKIENERLKESLECRENEVGCLKEEVNRLENDLKNSNSDNHDSSSAEVDVTDAGGKENGSPDSEVQSHRNLNQEMAVVRDALGSLRECFTETDPHQHTIDTIEQTLSSFSERIIQTQKLAQGHKVPDLPRRPSFSMCSFSDINGSYISSNIGLPVPSVDLDQSFSSKPSTKLVYYTNKSSTPFVSTIHKRLGEITLRDLKSRLDRPGQFRFHFKTLDPEYGMVKEEVVHDDAIIPGWDERIVAWIEKVDE